MRTDRTRAAAVAIMLVLVGSVGTVRAADYTGNVGFLIGGKFLDESDWEPVETQIEFGVLGTWGKKSWPVHIATDLTLSIEDNNTAYSVTQGPAGTTLEFSLGVRKIWKHEKVRPFLGGGVAYVSGELTNTVHFAGSPSDSGAGGWIDGGILWRLGQRFDLGFEARVSSAKIKPAGQEVNAGGEHLGLIFGFDW